MGPNPAVGGLLVTASRRIHEDTAVDEIIDARRELGRVLGARLGQRREDLFHRARDREGVEHRQRDARREVTLTVDLDDDLVLVREANEDILCPYQHRVGADLRGLRSVVGGHRDEDSTARSALERERDATMDAGLRGGARTRMSRRDVPSAMLEG